MADWDKLGTSGDVEDRRSVRTPLLAAGGVAGLIITGALLFLSGQPGDQILSTLLQQILSSESSTSQTASTPDSTYKKFASEVLGSTTQYWTMEYKKQSKTYIAPKLVLFRSNTSTGCGYASSSVGPFYCPEDQTIYLDETFFDDIAAKLDANTGDVAQAYVIAHEVGHHVQYSNGTLSESANPIKTELQADCYAGSWTHSITHIFDSPKEINEALDLASSIGDDKIQEKTEGRVHQETWTHGSSAQRHQWFKTGYNSGNPALCTP